MKGGYYGLTNYGANPTTAVELVVGDNTNNGGGYAAGKCPVIPLPPFTRGIKMPFSGKIWNRIRIKILATLAFLLFFAISTYGQAPPYEYFVAVNGNLYLPIGKSGKGMYPILGYKKETDTKVLIGGLGIGISAFKPVKPKVSLKGQANLSKHTYWDETIQLNDENGYPTEDFKAGSSDYALGLTAMAHYFIKERISVGTGLGAQVLLISLSRTPDRYDYESSIMVNRYYKPFMPVLPLELSYKSSRHLFNIRYEQALLNRLRGGVQAYKKDAFGLLTFELGLKMN